MNNLRYWLATHMIKQQGQTDIPCSRDFQAMSTGVFWQLFISNIFDGLAQEGVLYKLECVSYLFRGSMLFAKNRYHVSIEDVKPVNGCEKLLETCLFRLHWLT